MLCCLDTGSSVPAEAFIKPLKELSSVHRGAQSLTDGLEEEEMTGMAESAKGKKKEDRDLIDELGEFIKVSRKDLQNEEALLQTELDNKGKTMERLDTAKLYFLSSLLLIALLMPPECSNASRQFRNPCNSCRLIKG